MSNLHKTIFKEHPLHLVSPSPWPLFTWISLLCLTTTGTLTVHGFSNSEYWLFCALICLVSSMAFWCWDVGNHTLAVQRSLNMEIALFIVSGAIILANFHSALSPSLELGGQLLPIAIIFNALNLSVNYVYSCITHRNRDGALLGIVFIIFLIMLFTGLQEVDFTQLKEIFNFSLLRTAHAETHNVELRSLGQYLYDRRIEIVSQRISIGAVSNTVSLAEIGFRGDSLLYSDKIDLFERFIDKNPHLSAFNQYYKWADNTLSRKFSTVLITQELTDAMYNCEDLSL